MFRRLIFPILIIFAVLFSSCEQKETAETCRRTLLVYIEGRNNLSNAALNDLEEMRRAYLPKDCRLLVYKSISGEDKPVLMEIKHGKDSVIITYPSDALATDPEQMRRVLSDVKNHAPSEEFGVIFWSHSSGWRQKAPSMSRGYGLEYSTKQMSITDLAGVLEDFSIDFIFFDTCYMGCVEVAYELRNVAQRLVASVCEVPTDGMPYDKTLPHLFNTDLDAGLKGAIDVTVDYYTDSKITSCPSTLSLIDLTKIDDIAHEVKRVINNPLPEGKYQRFSRSTPYKDLFFDLRQYLANLGGNTSVINAAVIHERHTPYPIWDTLPLEHCCGLTVFIPLSSQYNYQSYDYNTLSWAKYLNLN